MDLQFRTCSPDGRTFTYDRQEWAQRRARELVDQGFAPVVVEVGQFVSEGAWKAERVIGSAGHHIAEQRRLAREAVREARLDRQAERLVDVIELFAESAAQVDPEEYDDDRAPATRNTVDGPDDGLGLSDGEPDGGYLGHGPESHQLEHESAHRLRQQTRHPQAA